MNLYGKTSDKSQAAVTLHQLGTLRILDFRYDNARMKTGFAYYLKYMRPTKATGQGKEIIIYDENPALRGLRLCRILLLSLDIIIDF